ncbi:MAG: hypothetical protein IJX17_00835 [Clostridia bacterium]|nr:hypothetical protein [Clostridia bacterium]
MKFNGFTMPAKEINEDAMYICEKFGFVLDGATGLLKENVSPIKSDAAWFTQIFREFLINNLDDTSKSIQEIIIKGIIEIDNAYMSFPNAEYVKSKPSSGVAIYRINNDKLEYFILGDCSFLVSDKTGNITHLKLDDLTRLDAININKMAEIAKKQNINVVDARVLINDDLVKTRLMQNTDEGYWILSDDTEAPSHALVGEIQLDSISQIVGTSDGFSQIYDTFFIYTKEELMAKLSSNTPIEELYKTLCNEQDKDAFCNEKPRFKLRDDATLIYAEF